MTSKHYVPILKWKAGERKALRELSDEIKNLICPLFIVMPDSETDTFLTQVVQTWGNKRQYYFDFHPNFSQQHDINEFLEALLTEELKTNFIPVISTNRDNDFHNTIKTNIDSFSSGIAIRTFPQDFENITTILREISQNIGIKTRNIDLIIDLGQIDYPREMFSTLVAIVNSIIAQIQTLEFRKIIVSGSSFPDVLKVPQNSISTKLRKEWEIWNNIHDRYQSINFSDYGVDDPHDPIIDQRVTIIPTIRYTRENCWYIVRGVYDPRTPYDFAQFHRLSQNLIKDNSIYCGRDYSWGDLKIYECANKSCTGSMRCNHGNLLSWVQINTNHHLTFVARQVSNLF